MRIWLVVANGKDSPGWGGGKTGETEVREGVTLPGHREQVLGASCDKAVPSRDRDREQLPT